MVATNTSDTPLWTALRFFTYSAIILCMSGVFISMACMGCCTSLANGARNQLLKEHDSPPERPTQRRFRAIWRKNLSDPGELLRSHGMSPKYGRLRDLLYVFLTLGTLFSFTAITLWIWLTENHLTAGVTMITIVPAFMAVVYALFWD